MKEMQTLINVRCADAECYWPGAEPMELSNAKHLAQQHLTHTGHGVLITQRTWFVDDDEAVEAYEQRMRDSNA